MSVALFKSLEDSSFRRCMLKYINRATKTLYNVRDAPLVIIMLSREVNPRTISRIQALSCWQ